MREIFEALTQTQAKIPEMKQNPIWYPMKIQNEEAGELLSVTSNDPTPEQLAEMLKEGADVILCVVSLFDSVGITPEVATQAILDKIKEIGERSPDSFTGRIRGVPSMLDYEDGIDTELVLFTHEN